MRGRCGRVRGRWIGVSIRVGVGRSGDVKCRKGDVGGWI